MIATQQELNKIQIETNAYGDDVYYNLNLDELTPVDKIIEKMVSIKKSQKLYIIGNIFIKNSLEKTSNIIHSLNEYYETVEYVNN